MVKLECVHVKYAASVIIIIIIIIIRAQWVWER